MLHNMTLEGSFSLVSKSIFANKTIHHRERERAPVVDVIWGDWFF